MTKRLKDELETLSKWRTVIQDLPKEAASTPPTQEGWPTQSMIEAGAKVLYNEGAFPTTKQDDRVSRLVIEAALAAAPTPPAAKRSHWNTDGGWKCTNCGKGLTQHEDQTFCPTSPAQEDEPVAEIVVKNTFGYDVYEAELIGAGVNLPKGTKLYTRSIDEGFYGRLAAKKCQEFRKLRKAIGEHLAFVHRDGGHYRQKVGDTQAIEDATNVVLADRQQLIEMGRLRKAAADALCILDIWKEQGRFPLGVLQAELNIIERLRAALERNLTPSSTDTQSPA